MSSSQHVDECVIRWWKGYVKSCFYVLVDASSSDDSTLIESPMFWSFRKSSLTPDEPTAAAHQLLVETLLLEGWEPAGVGESWYEQWFVREGSARVADDEPSPEAPADASPLGLEAPPEPAKSATADERALRVVTKRTPSRSTPPADTTASPKQSPPGQAGKRAQTGGKSQSRARTRQATTAGGGKPPTKAAPARRGRRPPARATGSGRRRNARSSWRSRHLGTAATVVAWAVFAAAVVAALVLVLNGS